MLNDYFRFNVENNTGASIAIAGATVNGKLWKLDSNGATTYSTEQAIYSNSAAIATASNLAEDTYNNSTNKYFGGWFEFQVNIATGSPSGDVDLWLENSTDGGTTWPTEDHIIVAKLSFTATGTIRTQFEL